MDAAEQIVAQQQQEASRCALSWKASLLLLILAVFYTELWGLLCRLAATVGRHCLVGSSSSRAKTKTRKSSKSSHSRKKPKSRKRVVIRTPSRFPNEEEPQLPPAPEEISSNTSCSSFTLEAAANAAAMLEGSALRSDGDGSMDSDELDPLRTNNSKLGERRLEKCPSASAAAAPSKRPESDDDVSSAHSCASSVDPTHASEVANRLKQKMCRKRTSGIAAAAASASSSHHHRRNSCSHEPSSSKRHHHRHHHHHHKSRHGRRRSTTTAGGDSSSAATSRASSSVPSKSSKSRQRGASTAIAAAATPSTDHLAMSTCGSNGVSRSHGTASSSSAQQQQHTNTHTTTTTTTATPSRNRFYYPRSSVVTPNMAVTPAPPRRHASEGVTPATTTTDDDASLLLLLETPPPIPQGVRLGASFSHSDRRILERVHSSGAAAAAMIPDLPQHSSWG